MNGSRCPGPSRGPQPQIGSSAQSTPVADLDHLGEQLSVAGEVDPRICLDQVANRPDPTRAGATTGAVAGMYRRDPQGTDLQALALAQLHHVVKSVPPEKPPRSARRNDRGSGGEAPQRGEVEMVVVQVRDQHGVRTAGRTQVGQGRAAAKEAEQPVAKQRVGQDAGSCGLDRDRRVPDEGDPRVGRARPGLI